MGGTPVFTETRVPIQTLFDYIEGGDDLNEFLDDYPSVAKEAAIEVLENGKKVIDYRKDASCKLCLMKIYPNSLRQILDPIMM